MPKRSTSGPQRVALPIDVRREIKAQLVRMGKSRKQLAAMVDIHPQYLHQILAGHYGGLNRTCHEILDAVGLRLVAVPKDDGGNDAD